MKRSFHRANRAFAAAALAGAATFAATEARADEQNLIKNAGDHPQYFFDAEPHGIVAYGPWLRQFAPGLGFRGTFIIVQNGFIPKLNNSVGIGVGGDILFGRGSATFVVPAVLQWNFWLSTHWAVFGEPGVALGFGGARATVSPVFAVGGKYHFSERVALTLRVGYPMATVGVSFYL